MQRGVGSKEAVIPLTPASTAAMGVGIERRLLQIPVTMTEQPQPSPSGIGPPARYPDAEWWTRPPAAAAPQRPAVLLHGDWTGQYDQGDRLLCWAFTAVAALELAYLRIHQLRVRLSAHFAAHITRAFVPMADTAFTDGREEYPARELQHALNDYGGWSAACIQAIRTAPICEEQYCPYRSLGQLRQLPQAACLLTTDRRVVTERQIDEFEFSEGNIPLQARHMASYAPTDCCVIPWERDADDFPVNPAQVIAALETALSDGYEVAVDLVMQTDPSLGRWPYLPQEQPWAHSMLLYGYDRASETFTFHNWWPGQNTVRASYELVSRCIYCASLIRGVSSAPVTGDRFCKRQFWLGKWEMDHDGHRGELWIRRTAATWGGLNVTKIGYYYADGRTVEVTGQVKLYGQEMTVWLAPPRDGGAVAEFHLYVFSWDPVKIAGKTSWHNIPFGCLLRRQAIPAAAAHANTFSANSWLGRWSMNHDGHQGVLDIQAVDAQRNTVSGTYQGRPFSGSLHATHRHWITTSLPMQGAGVQPFELYYHTWENNYFSGCTQWDNRPFGVQGTRA